MAAKKPMGCTLQTRETEEIVQVWNTVAMARRMTSSEMLREAIYERLARVTIDDLEGYIRYAKARLAAEEAAPHIPGIPRPQAEGLIAEIAALTEWRDEFLAVAQRS